MKRYIVVCLVFMIMFIFVLYYSYQSLTKDVATGMYLSLCVSITLTTLFFKALKTPISILSGSYHLQKFYMFISLMIIAIPMFHSFNLSLSINEAILVKSLVCFSAFSVYLLQELVCELNKYPTPGPRGGPRN